MDITKTLPVSWRQWPELGWSAEVTSCWESGPSEKYTRILDRALKMVAGVPYAVTLRWLFYGLWQEGYFSFQKSSDKKSAKALAYGNFSKAMSRLRHSPDRFQERWPIELADDRRDPIHRTQGFADVAEWLGWERERLACNVDKMVGQDRYILVAFEAEAMQSQFKHYTEKYGVSLWPFSGATSIPYKQRMAGHIEWINDKFGLPTTILYFGDLDLAGEIIPETAFRHVRKWCDVRFDAYRVGLNREHIQEYGIEEDPEKPGKFQWEAVNDQAAREIITGALDSLLRLDAIDQIGAEEDAATTKVRQALEQVEL